MSKSWTGVIWIVVIAFAVSFGLSFVASATGSDIPSSTFAVLGLSVAGAVAAIYFARTVNRRVELADATVRAAALGEPPAEGARLIVARSGLVGKFAGIDVLVDGAFVAQLKSPRFTAIDRPPGPCRIEAIAQGKTTPPLEIDLPAGATQVVNIIVGVTGTRLERGAADDRARRALADVPMVVATLPGND